MHSNKASEQMLRMEAPQREVYLRRSWQAPRSGHLADKHVALVPLSDFGASCRMLKRAIVSRDHPLAPGPVSKPSCIRWLQTMSLEDLADTHHLCFWLALSGTRELLTKIRRSRSSSHVIACRHDRAGAGSHAGSRSRNSRSRNSRSRSSSYLCRQL